MTCTVSPSMESNCDADDVRTQKMKKKEKSRASEEGEKMSSDMERLKQKR